MKNLLEFKGHVIAATGCTVPAVIFIQEKLDGKFKLLSYRVTNPETYPQPPKKGDVFVFSAPGIKEKIVHPKDRLSFELDRFSYIKRDSASKNVISDSDPTCKKMVDGQVYTLVNPNGTKEFISFEADGNSMYNIINPKYAGKLMRSIGGYIYQFVDDLPEV